MFRTLSSCSRLAAVVLTLGISACGGGGGSDDDDGDDDDTGAESGTKQKDRGDFKVRWDTPPAEVADFVEYFQDEELFEGLAEGLNDTFILPRNLPITFASCGESNAFYSPEEHSITYCYELLADTMDAFASIDDDEDEWIDDVTGTTVAVLLHELGHALIDYYDLAATGREEDAVDDFSSWMLVIIDVPKWAIATAAFWLNRGQDQMFDMSDFADEHSLNPQRGYAIACNVYGSDPDTYDYFVPEVVPEARADKCVIEWEKKTKAWATLLAPWVKD